MGSWTVGCIFYKICKNGVGNGLNTRLWEDTWLGDVPLCNNFARLYNVNVSFNISVTKVFNEGWRSIMFRRHLRGVSALAWQELQGANVVLSENRDRCIWTLNNSGQLSVKSMYFMLNAVHVWYPFKYVVC